MTDVPRGTLFGVPVEFSVGLEPGHIDVHGHPFKRPEGWGLMDNAARLVWMHQHYPELRFRVGAGTEESMLTTMNEERQA